MAWLPPGEATQVLTCRKCPYRLAWPATARVRACISGEAEVSRYIYRLYGLTLASERRLALLSPAGASAGAADVTIAFAPLSPRADPPVVTEGKLTIYGDGEARFTSETGLVAAMSLGRHIVVDAPADHSTAGLHAALFGPAMGWLLHQRGLVPLHGCGIEIAGRLVALVGHSGMGKSTLGRALVARGGRLLGDDQLVIDPSSCSVAPGINALRLWGDAARHSGDTIVEAARIIPGHDKFQIKLDTPAPVAPVPLALVVAIGRDPTRDRPRFLALDRAQAAAMLHTHVYQRQAASAAGRTPALFAWSTRLAAQVPVVALDRPDRLDQLSDLCDGIERRVSVAAEPTA